MPISAPSRLRNANYGLFNDPLYSRKTIDLCDVARKETTDDASLPSMSSVMAQLLRGLTHTWVIPGLNSERGRVQCLTLSIIFLSYFSQMPR
jgi:hypothetical protein